MLVLIVPLVVFLLIGGPLGNLLGLVLGFGYTATLNGQGGTVGKRALGLRVVDQRGNVPGFAKGAIRAILPLSAAISNLLLGPGFFSALVFFFFTGVQLFDGLWMLVDERSQTLHDKMAGTYVVRG